MKYFKNIKCVFRENGSIRANDKLTGRQLREIHSALAERDLQPPVHFHVAFITQNRGIYAKLMLLKRLEQYRVIRTENLFIFIRNDVQETQD